MKVELIETININDLIEERYYSPRKEVSRRDFLKYSAVGGLGLMLPLTMTEDSEAVPLWLIPAIVPAIKLIRDIFFSGQETEGEVVLLNNKNETARGDLKLTLVDQWDLDNQSSIQKAGYVVPPQTGQRYHFSGGPSLNVGRDTQASFSARSQVHENSVNGLTILV